MRSSELSSTKYFLSLFYIHTYISYQRHDVILTSRATDFTAPSLPLSKMHFFLSLFLSFFISVCLSLSHSICKSLSHMQKEGVFPPAKKKRPSFPNLHSLLFSFILFWKKPELERRNRETEKKNEREGGEKRKTKIEEPFLVWISF